MKKQWRHSSLCIAATVAALAASPSFAQSVDTARIDAGGQNDWLDLSRFVQVVSLQSASLRSTPATSPISVSPGSIFPAASTRGLQSMPLVADGVLYYTGSYSRTFALNGATGEVIWSYFPELDEALVARQTHSPYNRGVAIGDGKVYVGTVDGRLIALDMKTGKVMWDTKLVDSQKLTVGFTGAPLLRQGHGRDRRAGRRMAGPRPDLRRRRRDRQEEMGVPDRRRHRRGHEDLGQ